MSGEARKVFDIEEQKAKEIITAIKAAAPVIPLIREWGRYEKELCDLTVKIKELQKVIDAIAITIESVEDNSLKEQLQKEVDIRVTNYNVAKIREGELQGICKNIEEEVISYQKYAKLHGWVTLDNLKKALELEPFEEDKDLLPVMFFVYNRNSMQAGSEKERAFIQVRYSMNDKIWTFVFKDWNTMLESLKSNLI